MGIFQDWTSIAWATLIFLMVSLEIYTLSTKRMGDTLSEHLRRLLGIVKDPQTGVRYKGGLYTVLRALFIMFFCWFIVHIIWAIV